MEKLNEAIFPIITFNPENKIWNCLGTGYFINPVGGFATARHLFFHEDKQVEQTLYGVHLVNNEEFHIRPVYQLVSDPTSDIMIGRLGERRLKGGENLPAMQSEYFALDFELLSKGDDIMTYAFPKTTREVLESGETEFSFEGRLERGKIVDLHNNGTSQVKNRCYQTTMNMESGASGGPVLKDGYIVGINSSSFELPEGEEPISFITPIDYILGLKVESKGKLVPVAQLIKSGFIKTK